ncbi:MAG TPA: polyphosphate kinase 1 [Thermoanaerobaculia bacterium]|nr:polyphosphate kinase 1 [Thermoanaerobaculia bacterium]
MGRSPNPHAEVVITDDTAAHSPPVVVPLPPMAVPSEPVTLFNRELSWLEFNDRVVHEAKNPEVPLLERLKFLAIASSNLDEFLMVRLGSLRDLMTAGIKEKSYDGLTPRQQIKLVRERARHLLETMYATLGGEILPQLQEEGIRILQYADFSKKDQHELNQHFREQIAPILTPLAFDPGHPFPFLANRSLNLAVILGSERAEEHVVFLKLPSIVPRLIQLRDTSRYIPLESLIAEHVGEFYPGLNVLKTVPFRVVRNADLSIREDEVEQDLLQSIEAELRRRERKEVVWMEIESPENEGLTALLARATQITREDIFLSKGLLKLSDLMQIYSEVRKPSLRDPAFNPRIPSELASSEDIFSIIRKQDVLLHRPYDSFTAVLEFVQAAAHDPDVLAIKQTLYRSDHSSPVIEALTNAAVLGKQVTVVVELQARFDELKNISWAKRLEEAGVQVVYGLVGLKTHCKLCLVVRREEGRLRRYIHFSSGNYNAVTAALYTDIDLFTIEEDLGEDVSSVFNLLTGFSLSSAQEIFEGKVPELRWRKLVVAPMDFHRWTLARIEREIQFQKSGKPAGIRAKMNSLVDPTVVEALYRASTAGVRIDLLVRGICTLVPGVKGLSENIRVHSIVDRFLEHSRIFEFQNGGDREVWIASGDWMPRNFFRRIEVAYPILSEALKTRVADEILTIGLSDDVKGWSLQSDGTYRRLAGGKLRSQERFIEIARSEAVRVGPYEESLKKPSSTRRKAKKLRKKDRGPK